MIDKPYAYHKPSEDGMLEFGDMYKAEDRSGWKGGFDLIYALPGQTAEAWQAELVRALMVDGFSRSAIYRCLDQFEQQNVITMVGGQVHLNGKGKV